MEDVLSESTNPKREEQILSGYSMTGNLMQALKSLAVLLLHEVEFLENLTPNGNGDLSGKDGVSLDDELGQFEIELIRNALMLTRGHQLKAARILEIKKTTLNAKLKHYGIDPRSFIISASEINV
ncbi:MAG: helix-turn-helix domain-containing protein [Acidobacteriota bacterium]